MAGDPLDIACQSSLGCQPPPPSPRVASPGICAVFREPSRGVALLGPGQLVWHLFSEQSWFDQSVTISPLGAWHGWRTRSGTTRHDTARQICCFWNISITGIPTAKSEQLQKEKKLMLFLWISLNEVFRHLPGDSVYIGTKKFPFYVE